MEYITPALEQKYIELTFPNRINHPNQKYRLTAKGLALKAELTKTR
ncbi:Fic family protein [Mongoliitalea lutea]